MSTTKAKRFLVTSGSDNFALVTTSVANPNGVIFEASGSICRGQNGSLWRNTDGATAWEALVSVSGTNIGSGVGVHDAATASTMTFRSMSGSGGISVTLANSTVVISGSTTPSLLGIGLGFFGDGSDGDAVLDGAATVLGMVPVGVAANVYGSMGAVNRYVPVRDMHFNDLTIDSGVFLSTNHRVFVKGTLTLTGFLGFAGVNGSNGNAGTGGAGGGAGGAGSLGAQFAGGAGGAPAGGAVGGTAATACPPGAENTGGTGGAANNDGAAGGRMKGGGGGGGSGAGTGGSAGIVTIAGAGEGSLSNLIQAATGRYLLNNTRYTGGSGAGGGRGVGAGNGGGGGGGSSGGPVLVCARTITGAGSLWANGGDGGDGYQGALTVDNGCAGGGGGGGGWIVCIIGYGSFPTMTVTGGVGGLANNDGTATAGDGGDGGDGFTYQFMIGVTPP